MGFAGNLQTLALAEVLQTLNRIHGSGVLRLASTHGGREVVFANGEIIGIDIKDSDSRDSRNSLLRLLIALGKIDAEKAGSISEGGGGTNAIVDALVQRGLLSANDIAEVMSKQAIDELYDIWTWEFGDFVFAEAGADAEATAAVERWKPQALKVNLNSLLMESARRQDEWSRLRQRLADDTVLAVEPGQETQIAQAGREYPASAVLPLIDGVRAIGEIQRDSVATRLDVFGVIADQMDLGTLRTCTPEDLLGLADQLADQADMHRAADLYTKVLARKPADTEVISKLGDILDQTDQFPSAPMCWQQLALARLQNGQGESAVTAAKRAVELQPQAPESRLALVRCLVDGGDDAGAIAELRKVGFIYRKLGRLEDARGTCLKILELDPADKEVHQDLAKIFSGAERDAESEDVVVCAQCGEVNKRDAAACTGCAAKLRLSCAKCSRTIAVSDRLCIFCGADVPRGAKLLPSSPATSRIIDSAKVRKEARDGTGPSWRVKIEVHVKAARAHEDAGRIEQALAEWKEAAQYQIDNAELSGHIRQLENLVHERFIEGRIEEGHRLRRQRRFFRAARCYQAALRTMSAKDERSEPLRAILIATERGHLRVSVIYGAAAIILVCIGVMVAKPFVQERRFEAAAGEFEALLAGIDQLGPIDGEPVARQARKRLTELEEAADQVRRGSKQADHVRTRLTDLENGFSSATGRANTKLLAAADAAATAGDLKALDERLRHARAAVGEVDQQRLKALDERLAALRKAQADHDRAVAEAPNALENAKKAEQAGRLADALHDYDAIARLGQAATVAAATAGVARLTPQAEAWQAKCARLNELMDQDLVRARKDLEAMAGEAKAWNAETAVHERGQVIDRRLADATAAWKLIGDKADEATLRAFIDANPGAPQQLQARARLNQVANQSKNREQALERYRKAVESADVEEAWKQARLLLSEHRTSLAAGEVLMPLAVDSSPRGAAIAVDGVDQGATPRVVRFDPGTAKEITLTLAGHKPMRRPVGELAGDWRWQAALERMPIWSARLARGVALCAAAEGGRSLVGAGDTLTCFDRAGKELWRRPLVSGDDLIDSGRVTLAHAPVALADGRLVYANADHGVAVLDAKGKLATQYPTQKAVRGAPVAYENELLGGGARLAFAAESLVIVRDGGRDVVPLPGGALSGPVVVARDLDRLLVVATLAGQLLAFEESTREKAWDLDLGAADVGQLIPTGDGGVVVVLDGGRMSCFDLREDGAVQRWSVALAATPVGDPLVIDGTVLLACGKQVVRHGLSGTSIPPLPLPSPASSAVAAGGGRFAAGCKDGELVVFTNDGVVWTNPCAQAVTGVCLPDGLVVAGLADGALIAFVP